MGHDDEKSWIVRIGDAQRGPVSLDQVRRAAQAGKLPGDAEVCREGEDRWRRVADVVGSGAERSQGARASEDSWPDHEPVLHQAPKVAARKGGGRRRLVAWGGAVLGVAALGVAGWFAYRTLVHPKPKDLPIVAKKLPQRTTLVSEGPIGEFREDVAVLPDAYVNSALAHLACGAPGDIVETLALSRGKDAAWLKTHGVLDLPRNDSLRRSLACAATIRASLTSPSGVVVKFDDDKSHEVLILRSSLSSLPSELGFVRHSFGGLEGQCHHEAGDKVDCPEGTPSAFHDGTTWVFGSFSAVESFARAYTTAREELTTTVDILQETIGNTEASDLVTVSAKPDAIPWSGPCMEAAPVEHVLDFVGACFPKGEDKLLEGVTTKVRGLAIERNVLAKADGYKWAFVLLLRDEEAARDVEKDLQDLSRDWRAQFTNGEPTMAKLLREQSDYVQDEFWKAAFDPYLRAMRNMSVKRAGSVVRLTIAEKLRPEEAKTLKEFVDTRTQDQAALTKIVDALTQGTAIPEKSLATFLGADLAAWVLAPRATDADCKQVGDKLASLTKGDIPIELFGVKYDMEHRYGAKSCVGMVFPPSFRQCLTDAADLRAFAACKAPRSPYALSAEKRLEGQWEADTVHGDASQWAIRVALSHARMEFGGGHVALVAGDARLAGDADIDSDGPDRASFALTSKGATVRKDVQFVDDDTIKVLSLDPRVDDVVFKRAKFESSVLASDAGVAQQ